MIARLAERDLKTKFGTFNEILYYDGRSESIALVMGDVARQENVLCRIHSACISGHVFNSVECECAAEMEAAQDSIRAAGRGVVIYLEQEGRGNGHLALIESIPFKKAGSSQSEAYEKAGFSADTRSYRPAAAILADLDILSVVLLTDNLKKVSALEDLSIPVSGTMRLSKK